MVKYTSDVSELADVRIEGFFGDWPVQPTDDRFKSALCNALYVELAIEDDQLIGFVYAHADGEISAYIPLLEVLPQYQRRGVAIGLMTRLLARLSRYYMIDITCDDEVLDFYAQFDLSRTNALIRRRPNALR